MGIDGADLKKRREKETKPKRTEQNTYTPEKKTNKQESETGDKKPANTKPSTLKRLIKPAIVAGVALLIFVIAGPFLTLHAIKNGAQQGDTEKLSRNIDFPRLRQNLKDQLKAQMASTMTEEAVENPFVVMFSGFANSMVDGLVDSAVTPYGIKKMLQGQRPTPGQKGQPDSGSTEMLQNANYSITSTSRFVATIGEPESEIKLILHRRNLSWVLTNIELPEVPDQGQLNKLRREGISTALKMYKLDNGKYPTTRQGLMALVEKPTTQPIPPRWRQGGYMEDGESFKRLIHLFTYTYDPQTLDFTLE